MEDYSFKVYSFHSPEYRNKFYGMFEKWKKAGKLDYTIQIEETAPPPELIKDIVTVTASTLTILKILYDFYKVTKKKKGKVIVRIEGEDLDLESYNMEELQARIKIISKNRKRKKQSNRPK